MEIMSCDLLAYPQPAADHIASNNETQGEYETELLHVENTSLTDCRSGSPDSGFGEEINENDSSPSNSSPSSVVSNTENQDVNDILTRPAIDHDSIQAESNISDHSSPSSTSVSSVVSNTENQEACNNDILTPAATGHNGIQAESNISDIFVVDFNSEMNRLLSFPDSFPYSRASVLAKSGFYFLKTVSMLLCQFCRIHVDLSLAEDDSKTTEHQCAVEQIMRHNKRLPSDVTNYRYETNRIISFLSASWNKEVGKFPVGALDLARWGFFYMGKDDSTRCVFCRLEVQGWEVGDTAETEHRRWNSLCPFISGRTVGNIKLGEEEVAENNMENDRVYGGALHATRNAAISGILQASAPKHPEYASLTSRIDSYNLWPSSMKQKPPTLSEAGFYYTGKGDRVICYQCGGGLKDWEVEDDPWVEHAKWFSNCMHVSIKKGQAFIEKILQTDGDAGSEENIGENLNHSEEMEVAKQEAATYQQDESTSQSEVALGRECKVCMDKELGIVFLPCGHMASCIDCAPQLSKCPVCRGPMAAYIRAYLP